MTPPKKLFLIDAYAMIFRAYYALIKAPRITSRGVNTSAVFGFVNTLEEVLAKERPTHIAVCFDPPGPTFRDKEYEDYKAGREETPEDIRLAVPYIKRILEAYRIPVVEVEGYEADDVIGTLATRAAAEGFTAYMMTPDKDFGQLVGPSILQYKPPYRGADFELRGEEEVCQRYGLKRPEQVIDLLALMGDKIDNIPGCPGVGEKTAVKLIADFDNIENLLEHTDELKGALRTKIETNAEQIRFSKHMATICTDVPTGITTDELQRRPEDLDALYGIFDELEFRTLKARVQKRLGTPAPSAQPSLFDIPEEEPAPATGGFDHSAYATTDTSIEAMQNALADKQMCGIFPITTGETDMTAVCRGIAVASEPGTAFWLDFSIPEHRAAALDLLARPDILKVTSRAKLIYVVAARLRNDNADPLIPYHDIGVEHYLLQPEQRHDAASLAATYLHLDISTPTDTPLAACEQADACLRLKPIFDKELESEGLAEMFRNIEQPLVRVLAEMEITGVRLDVRALDDAAEKMKIRMADLEKEIHSLAGAPFKIDSPKQVGEVIFERLKLADKPKKTKSGNYSTSEDILEKLAPKHPVVSKILEYRQMKKLYSTYLTTLPQSVNPRTGRVHTNYNQTVTATGRISSSNPNLQNIPVRDAEGRDIRKAFIPDPGHLFLSADYSQIELRLVADFAQDETMLDAFAHDRDIHAITASKIYHEPLENVTPEQRRNAKTANFGILYGISAFGLSQRLGISRQEAKDLIDGYFATFPKVHKYMNDAIETAHQEGFVRTKWGRKRMLPDINSRNPVVRGYAERNAINAPLQGFAADIIKKAMVDIDGTIREKGLKSKMIMQVHDELNFDVVPEELPQMQELVARLMENAYPDGTVRLEASMGTADNWLDAH